MSVIGTNSISFNAFYDCNDLYAIAMMEFMDDNKDITKYDIPEIVKELHENHRWFINDIIECLTVMEYDTERDLIVAEKYACSVEDEKYATELLTRLNDIQKHIKLLKNKTE